MTNRVIHQLINELQHSNEDAPAAVIAPLTVETIDNHVYFYCGVDGDRCLALLRTIREVDAKLRNERVSRSLASATFRRPHLAAHLQRRRRSVCRTRLRRPVAAVRDTDLQRD